MAKKRYFIIGKSSLFLLFAVAILAPPAAAQNWQAIVNDGLRAAQAVRQQRQQAQRNQQVQLQQNRQAQLQQSEATDVDWPSSSPLVAQNTGGHNPVVVQQPQENETVTATGIGINEERALRSAYQNAVRQVVGALVMSDTLVQNEQLIRDEILVHSDGFIERVERIGIAQTNDDGLVEVTIRATVQRGKVSRELIRTNVMEQRIDGESLYAQALTKIQAMESEKEMWQVIPAFFRESKVPESLYGARITRQPYYDAAKRKAIIEFEVFVDQTQYNAFVDALRKVLSTLQITTRQQTIRFNSSRDNNGIVSMNRVNSEERLNIIPNGRSGIVFSVNRNIPLTGVTQEGFVVDDDTFAEFQALALKEWLVRVESQDVAGNTLYREERVISELMSTYIGSGSEPRLFFIYPMLFSGGTDRLYNSRDRSALMGGWRFFNRIPLHGDGRSVKMSVELDWTPEQLRNLDSVRFSFHGQ